MKTVLHHFAYGITPNNLELVLELLEILGCSITYREAGKRWGMVGQLPISTRIQIIEVNHNVLSDLEKKSVTHIAFLSDKPEEHIFELVDWAKAKGVNYRSGGWSEKELWFDLPDIFVNFVIEIMHKSVVE